MKKILFIILLLFIICLTGCGVVYPNLNKNPIAFHTSNYTDEYDEASYLTIEYDNRVYLPYGTVKGLFNNIKLDQCIGYITQDETNSSIEDENNKDYRVYTLKEDQNHHYLMVYYIGTTHMNQPEFYRAMDTKNIKIKTPKYIGSLDYAFWQKKDRRTSSASNEFYGWIVEANENSIVVEVEPDSYERTISNLYRISITRPISGVNDFYVIGNKVKITYDGDIQETYPASVHATKIVLADK